MLGLASSTHIAGLVGLGGTLLLVYVAMILRKYVNIIIRLVDDQALLPDNGNGESTTLNGEVVHFRASDGWPLEGVLLRPDRDTATAWGAGRSVVIFAHEFGSDRSSCLRHCRPLLESGFDIFAFDFRGHGSSPPEPGYRPRQWPSDRETADMSGAIDYVETRLQRIRRPIRMGLFGLSRGACAAILAARHRDSVRAIVADGAYSSDLALEYFMRRFAPIFARIRVIARNHPAAFWVFLRWLLLHECARRFGCHFPSVRKALLQTGRKPILFIHGEKDSYIPHMHCQALYDMARGPKSIWIVPGAKHNQSLKTATAEYARRVVGFFEEHLQGEPVLDVKAKRQAVSSNSYAKGDLSPVRV